MVEKCRIRRWLTAAALIGSLACRAEPPTRSAYLRVLDLFDGEAAATHRFGIRVTRGPSPRIGYVAVEGDQRRSLTVEASSTIQFRCVIPRAGGFHFALAVAPFRMPVQVRFKKIDGSGDEELYVETFRDAAGWNERRVDLDAFVGKTVEFELLVDFEGEGKVSLAQPEIVGQFEEERRPNVLIYVIDCLRVGHVGTYGYPRPTTPSIDRLAEDGIVFETSYSCAAWTKSSTGCLFTSLYPPAHGAQTYDDVLSPANPTLAEILRSYGYFTGAWVANPIIYSETFGFLRGFERMVSTVEREGTENLIALEPDAADITRPVVSWLKENRDRLFFLYLHSLDAHYYYRPRPPFDEVFLDDARQGTERQIDLYDNEVAYNDRELGNIIEELKRLGLYDETLIIVTSDHGEEFGEHGYERHGHTLFEPAVRVPWVLKLPRSSRRGRRVKELSINLDVAPTVLEYAGIPPPESFQGHGWRSFLDSGQLPPSRLIYMEQLSARDVLYAARDARFKSIYRLIPQPEELLFDLVNDPGETEDLSASMPTEAEPLVNALHELVLLGQSGYHFSVYHPNASRWVVVDVRSDGRFEDVKRFSWALEEELSVSTDGHRLFYKFRTKDRRRHLIFHTEPPGAPVRVRLSVGDDPMPAAEIKLGGDGDVPGSHSFQVNPESVTVDLATAAALLRKPDAQARIWYLRPTAEREKARVDPELEEMLRVLGYAK